MTYSGHNHIADYDTALACNKWIQYLDMADIIWLN